MNAYPHHIVNTALYLLSVRKVNELSHDQRRRLEATGCHNKGATNVDAWNLTDRRTNAARYKVEVCAHHNPITGKGCPNGPYCGFFHEPQDRPHCAYWPHDIKVANYLAMAPAQRAALDDNLAILDREPSNYDTAEEATNPDGADYGSDSEGDSFRGDRPPPLYVPPPRGRTTPQPRPWRGTGFARGSIATSLVPPEAMPASPPSLPEEDIP